MLSLFLGFCVVLEYVLKGWESKLSLYIWGHLGVVAIFDKEGGQASRLMCCIVVGKLCSGKKGGPVIWLVFSEDL